MEKRVYKIGDSRQYVDCFGTVHAMTCVEVKKLYYRFKCAVVGDSLPFCGSELITPKN